MLDWSGKVQSDTDLIAKLNILNRRVDDMPRPEVNLSAAVNSMFQHIPGLVSFWPMSSVQRSTGNAYDLSGQGRTLTYNGNPTYNIYNSIVPYIDLDGVGDFLSRADETDLDVLGTEAIYAAAVRGLTLGGWFWFDAIVNGDGLMSKDDSATVAGSAYIIQCTAGNAVSFRAFGPVVENNIASAALSTGQWYFIVGRFIPSTQVDIFVNNIPSTNAVGINAALNNSTSPFNIGNRTGGAAWLLDGRVSLCFLSANALPTALIGMLFNQSRVLFGV